MGLHETKLRPLGVVALAMLIERPMHPYEMYQLLIARKQDKTVKLRPGTLYHGINWLESAGFIVATGTEREGNRPERTTYAATDAGRTALRHTVMAMLTEPAEEFPEFTVAMGEAHNLPKDEVLAALRERLAVVDSDRARGEQLLERVAERELPRRFILGGEFALNRARADVAWLNAVIEDIESGSLSWDAPDPHKHKETL
jgi:DNA-binding PadR family transcriptional regulator